MLKDGSARTDHDAATPPTTLTLAGAPLVPKREPLDAILSRWKTAMRDGATGPQLIAAEVMALGESWQDYRAQADDLAFEQWVSKRVHQGGKSFFRRLNDAVRAIGRTTASRMDNRAVLRVAGLSDHERDEACKRVNKAWKGQKGSGTRAVPGVPLSVSQLERIIRSVTGRKPCAKTCARCERLAEQLRAAGLDPVE